MDSGNFDLLTDKFGEPEGFAHEIESDLFVDKIELVPEIGFCKIAGGSLECKLLPLWILFLGKFCLFVFC